MSDSIEPACDAEFSWRYPGWRVVLAGFLMAMFIFGFGLYGNGVYLIELQRLRGWQAALISGAITLSLLVSNVLAVFTSELIGRFGARRLILLGLAGLAASTTVLALARQPWQLHLAYLLMSLGWTGMGTVVLATVVSSWFERRRGLALSLAFNGASCGGVLVAPLLLFGSEAIGFTATMLGATALMVVIVAPAVVMWIGPGGAGSGSGRDQDIAAPAMSRAMLLRRPAFWTLTAPFALGLLAQVGFIVHQIAMLEQKIGRAGAGAAVSLTTAMALLGRIGLGVVADRLDPRRVTAASFVSQALALTVISQADGAPLLLGSCALFGLSIGNLITLPPLIIHRDFEAPAFTVVLGLSVAISGMFCALGPAAVGLARSLTGGDGAALALCIALELAAAVLVMWQGKRAAVAVAV